MRVGSESEGGVRSAGVRPASGGHSGPGPSLSLPANRPTDLERTPGRIRPRPCARPTADADRGSVSPYEGGA